MSCFSKCQRLLVHSIDDLNRLKNIGLVDNVSLFPHPIVNSTVNLKTSYSSKKALSSRRKLVIGSYGFCLPHKGFAELIKAIPLIKQANINVKLNIISSIYNDNYFYVYQELVDLIKSLKLESIVTLNKEYLSSDDVQTILSQQDIIVFPYQESNESSSAAVRDGLASLKPVLVTPLRIFDDVAKLVDFSPGCSSSDLANGIISWYEKHQKNSYNENHTRANLIEQRRFFRLSLRLFSMIRSLEINNI